MGGVAAGCEQGRCSRGKRSSKGGYMEGSNPWLEVDQENNNKQISAGRHTDESPRARKTRMRSRMQSRATGSVTDDCNSRPDPRSSSRIASFDVRDDSISEAAADEMMSAEINHTNQIQNTIEKGQYEEGKRDNLINSNNDRKFVDTLNNESAGNTDETLSGPSQISDDEYEDQMQDRTNSQSRDRKKPINVFQDDLNWVDSEAIFAWSISIVHAVTKQRESISVYSNDKVGTVRQVFSRATGCSENIRLYTVKGVHCNELKDHWELRDCIRNKTSVIAIDSEFKPANISLPSGQSGFGQNTSKAELEGGTATGVEQRRALAAAKEFSSPPVS